MKKFWNLMLAALVIIGATACTENYENIEKAEGFSFYANFADTRATIEKDGEAWKTTWEGGEELIVNDTYTFTCTDAATGKFVCTDSNAAQLAGQNVNITTNGKHYSLEGAKAFYTKANVENFGEDKVELQALTSFFRFTYNGEVKISLSEPLFRTAEGDAVNEITVSGNGEQFVAFWPQGDNATLTYYVNNVECKSASKAFAAGMVYNLGELCLPYVADATWGIAGAFNGWAAGNPEPLYVVDNALVAFNLTKLNEGFKFVQNKGWDGAKGSKTQDAVASGEWLYCGDNDIMAADASAYDVYFVPARSMYCLVAAGSAAPELPVVEPIVWSLATSSNNWGDTLMTATDTANLFVAKGVELKSGDQIKIKDSKTWDTSYGGGIDNLEANKWMKAYFNGSNVVVAKSGTYDVYFEYAEGAEYSKLYLIEANADYTAAAEQTANGTLVPDGGSEPEQPEEVTPGEASDWSLSGTLNNWGDTAMVTTTVKDVFVAKSVKVDAYASFKVRKNKAWTENYGGGIVYFNPNSWMTVYSNGSDISNTAAGTYDFYFDYTNKRLYMVTAGADYTTVSEQTVNGEEPKQEEPEVTEKVVYLKPNSNWMVDNARFAAYFFGNGEVWVNMTAVGDGTYEVHLPEGFDYGCSVIFCRMNPSTTANNWNNKWNQTGDLTTPTDGKNLYEINAGSWDAGTWKTK